MGYYDIDDILADGTEVPCKFNYDIPGLGYLENNPGKPVRRHTKLQLPLWLARVLAIVGAGNSGSDGIEDDENFSGARDGDGGEPFVELLTPEMFSPRVINAIKTDGQALDLHTLSPHFLEVALKWVALFSDRQLGEIVYALVIERALLVNNHASSVSLGGGEFGGTQNRRKLAESLRLPRHSNSNFIGGPSGGGIHSSSGDGNGGIGPRGDPARDGRSDGGATSAFSSSQVTNLAASNRFLLTLDESERALYRRAHDSYRDTKRWMTT